MKRKEPDTASLIGAILGTRSDEITCDEWLKLVAPYAERIVRGDAISKEFMQLAEHLEYCRECSEEFAALLAALGR